MASARVLTGTSNISSGLATEVTQVPQLEVPEEAPTANEAALRFLRELSEEDYTYILFADHLSSVSEVGKELGEYKVTVEKTSRFGEDCFWVQASSHGFIDGIPCGTSISSYVTVNLETIEQQQHDYVRLNTMPLDRRVSINRCDEGLRISKDVVHGDKKETLSNVISFGTMEGFISEGANLLLQRLLITKMFPSIFDVLAFDSDSNLCQVSYNYLGEKAQLIGGKQIDVMGIQRVIQSRTDIPTSWHTYFMMDGHLVTRAQVGSPIVMKVLSVPELIVPDDHIPKPVFEKKPLDWEDDMELYSKFLDKKGATKAEHMAYLRSKPEVQALLSDFVQHLLQTQPEDTCAAAAAYFASFSSRPPPQVTFVRTDTVHPTGEPLVPVPKTKKEMI